MARYTVSAEIEADSLSAAWHVVANLPADLSTYTVQQLPKALRAFSIFDEANNREFSLSIYEKENNEQ